MNYLVKLEFFFDAYLHHRFILIGLLMCSLYRIASVLSLNLLFSIFVIETGN